MHNLTMISPECSVCLVYMLVQRRIRSIHFILPTVIRHHTERNKISEIFPFHVVIFSFFPFVEKMWKKNMKYKYYVHRAPDGQMCFDV